MTITAQQLFAQSGGQLSAAATLALAAYHLSAPEQTGDGINLSNAAGNQAFADLTGSLQWLTDSDLPALIPTATGNPDFPFDGLTGGVYTHGNAAAIIGRSTDALFLSFRGTNDTAGAGDVLFGTPDNNQWSDPAAHYAEFADLIAAVDAYVANGTNAITKVYVSGHSLGGAMAQEFMRTHAGALYEAVTFASIGSDLPGGADQSDPRETNIWINNDISRVRFAVTHEDVGDNNFVDSGLGFFSAGSIHDMRVYTSLSQFLDANAVPLSAINGTGALDIDSLILRVSDFRPADGVYEFGAANDFLIGTGDADIIAGGAGTDRLEGRSGADYLSGGAGDDHLLGGQQADTLRGGAGGDRFDFNSARHSARGASHDTILDMNRGIDHIDLKDIDAKLGAGNDAFRWIGAKKFHGNAGELHIVKKNGYVLVEGDINGDGRADFQIEADHLGALGRGDFIL
ncbi:MAG: M10 family metallopeptidase C-terminal domain-containing protein [Hyphomicrobium sp.]